MAAPKPPFELPHRISQSLWWGVALLAIVSLMVWDLWDTSPGERVLLVGLIALVLWMLPGRLRPTVLTADGFRVRWRTREIPFNQIVSLKTRWWWDSAYIATLRDGEKVLLSLGGLDRHKLRRVVQWINAQIASDAFE